MLLSGDATGAEDGLDAPKDPLGPGRVAPAPGPRRELDGGDVHAHRPHGGSRARDPRLPGGAAAAAVGVARGARAADPLRPDHVPGRPIRGVAGASYDSRGGAASSTGGGTVSGPATASRPSRPPSASRPRATIDGSRSKTSVPGPVVKVSSGTRRALGVSQVPVSS